MSHPANLLLFPALVAGTFVLQDAPRPARAADLVASVDSLVSVRAAQDSFAGTIAFARHGAIVYQRAAGLANRETREPMQIDTKLQIASTTKLFTQIAIRQLEQQGRLSLKDTLGKFLLNYHNVTARRRVTVEQLLTHRSGVGSFWNARFMKSHAQVRSVDDYIDLFQDDSLLFEPGTSETYSNGGYVLLGAIIEKVSGQRYQDYLRDHVFRPAGMTNTVPYDRSVARTNVAVGYTTQALGPITGDTRLAGAGPRPGYPARGTADSQLVLRTPQDAGRAGGPPPGMTLRLVGPDGKELSPEEAKAEMARPQLEHRPRQPNTDFQPGMSRPAGDHYSTAGDFIKLSQALLHHVLLDSARTAAVLGSRYAAGGDFRANGGGPGVNAEFSIFPSGDVLVVLSNYDPPAATSIAEFVRERIGR